MMNRTMKPGDIAVIHFEVEHEGYFPEDSATIDFFAPGAKTFSPARPHLPWHTSEPHVRRSSCSVVASANRAACPREVVDLRLLRRCLWIKAAAHTSLAISVRPPITWIARLTGAMGAT